MTYSSQLEQLLSEDVTAANAREQSAFDQAVAPFEKSLVLFGAGNLGKKLLRGLRSIGINPLAFADNNSNLWGRFIDGTLVLSPADAAARYGKSAAFINTIWRGEGTDTMAERCQPLVDLGCEKVTNFGVVFWKYPEVFLPHYSFDMPHKVLSQRVDVRSAFELLEDDASRAEFVAQIRWRLHLDFDGLPRPVKHEIYFPNDLVAITNQEVFVDCGAFDGDTMECFLHERGESFMKFIAFEADPKNFDKLKRNVAKNSNCLQNKITIYPLAVGARREKVRFNASGTEASAVGSGSLEIECAPLDEVLAKSPPTWVKMDIEGSELDALEGARGIITSSLPVLAVCVYHQQDHIWRIPTLINEMSNKYQFFLRPHLLESWDLVLYAVPRERRI